MTTYTFPKLEQWHLQAMCKFGYVLTGKDKNGYSFMSNPNEDIKTQE